MPPTIIQIAMRFFLAIAAGSVEKATKEQATPLALRRGQRLQEATSAIGAESELAQLAMTGCPLIRDMPVISGQVR